MLNVRYQVCVCVLRSLSLYPQSEMLSSHSGLKVVVLRVADDIDDDDHHHPHHSIPSYFKYNH